jgi:DNA-binding transcriptional MerR regulator
MHTISDTPAFNLKVVLQETGIKPDTIRAWERRYGLPEPERTAGGHRLYSQRDIEMIKWLMVRQDEGLSISRAVDLWRNFEAKGQDPLVEEAFATTDVTSAPKVNFAIGAALEDIRQFWIEACLVFDEPTAEATLTQAFALYPAEIVCIEVLQKGISQIGLRWYRGQASVQQEHFATALSLRKLNTLISASPAPHLKEKIVVACPPDEEHTFSALFITLALRQRGWPVIYLGANVPLDELNETISNLKPNLLVLPAQQLHTAARLAEIAREIRSQVPIAYGGLIFNLVPAMRQHIPGYFIGEELGYAALAIERLIRQSPPLPAIVNHPEAYQAALEHFQDQQAAIEAKTWKLLANNGIGRQHLTVANHHLTQDIQAALSLGDINFLGNEIQWLEELLENYEVPSAGLYHFLQTYQTAVRQELDERGAVVINWLTQALQSQ